MSLELFLVLKKHQEMNRTGPAFTKGFKGEVQMRQESVRTLSSPGGGEEELQRRHPGESDL